MKKTATLLALALLFCCSVFAYDSTIYPAPTYWSLKDLAQWSQPLFKTYASDPSIGNAVAGDMIVISDDSAFTIKRANAAADAWMPLTADLSAVNASLATMSEGLADASSAISTITSALELGATNISSATSNINNRATKNGTDTEDFATENLTVRGTITQYNSTPVQVFERFYSHVETPDNGAAWQTLKTFTGGAEMRGTVTSTLNCGNTYDTNAKATVIKRWGCNWGVISVLASETVDYSAGGFFSGDVQLVASGSDLLLQCRQSRGNGIIAVFNSLTEAVTLP